MELIRKINYLKSIALLLFICGSLSILGSLIFHNYILSFKFDYPLNYGVLQIEDKPGSFMQINCNKDNKYCSSKEFFKNYTAPKGSRLSMCYIYKVKNYLIIDGKIYNFTEGQKIIFESENYISGLDVENEKDFIGYEVSLKKNYDNSEIIFKKLVIPEKDLDCIKNTDSNNLYKIFPFWYESFTKLRSSKLNLGSTEPVNPFIYGETSISNLAKRFPINIVFKSFLYISVILMLMYWRSYNYLFEKILNQKKNYFFYFGISSAIFLFFHVFFLGSEIDNEIFQKLRRLIIILFILNELFAQISLTRQLYLNSSRLSEYCYLSIIKLKVLFIYVVVILSVIVILILVFYDLSSRIDYILEWNYFLGLLFYYLLSSVMLKKIKTNVSA